MVIAGLHPEKRIETPVTEKDQVIHSFVIQVKLIFSWKSNSMEIENDVR